MSDTTLYEFADFPAAWRWENFTPDELRCRHTGALMLRPAFLDRLQALRTAFRRPMIITSGYRHPTHPAEARKARPGSHALASAVDVAVSGRDAHELLKLAMAHGFTGIGVAKTFLHLDDCGPEYHAPRPNLWPYA